MPRRSGEDARRLLIATGIAMLHERGATVGVSHIRLQRRPLGGAQLPGP